MAPLGRHTRKKEVSCNDIMPKDESWGDKPILKVKRDRDVKGKK